MQGGAADGLTNMTMNSFSPAFGAGGAATQISNMEAMSIANQTNAERNISKMENNRARELEKMKSELDCTQ